MAKLIVRPLGCGGWVSDPALGPPSLLVEAGGLRLLVDAGEGVYAALRRCGFEVADLDLVLVTHKHGDHALGLPTLAMHARRSGARLRVIGPSDLDLRSLFASVGIPHYLEVLELNLLEPPAAPALAFEEGGVRVYAVAADHTVPSLAFRVEVGGLAVAFSGDTRPCRSIIELARGCKLLVHEVGGGLASEELAHEHGHSTLRDAVRIAVEAGVDYLMPFHFYLDPVALECEGVKLVLPVPCAPVDVAKLP
ncbi:MAG: MBL fold metallo-hydrolase [Thermofilaceae archaeon]